MPQPRSGEGHIVLPLSVRTYVYVQTSHFVVVSVLVSATPPTVFDVTCNIVQTCTEDVRKRNDGILIQATIAELFHLKRHTYFYQSSVPYVQQQCSCLHNSFLQYLMQKFKTCNIVKTYI